MSIPYSAVDVNFDNVTEQCFVIEVIGGTTYAIQRKYILMDPVLSADVDALNTALGAFPKTGGYAAATTYILPNNKNFVETYSGLISIVNATLFPTAAVSGAVAADVNATQTGNWAVGISQATPGSTDSVTVKAAGAFANTNTANLTNVAASATSVTLLASNANRKRVIICNDSAAKLRVKFGATASTTSFTLLLGAYDTYESPITVVYTGVIDGIWESATGTARVTEMI